MAVSPGQGRLNVQSRIDRKLVVSVYRPIAASGTSVMTRWIRALAISAVLICLALCPVSRSVSNSAAAPTIKAPAAPEARLRRIHLVRPDLIPYPIEYAVVC